MDRTNYTDDFSAWLRKDKFTILSGFIFALLPNILGIVKQILPNIRFYDNLIWDVLYYNLQHIVNIGILLWFFIMLTRRSFLMTSDDEKEGSLHEYVKMQFGESSTLAQNTPHNLYERLREGVKQFYYSWMAVWGVWLILYILIFVFSVYKYLIARSKGDLIIDLSDMSLFRMESLLENFLNLVNSFILLFIYLVITVSTVRVGRLAPGSHRVMHSSIAILVFIGAGCFFIDMFSLSQSISGEAYQQIQYYLRLVIGIIAAISFMAVLGRLNTNFLNIPQWMMISLYLYAAIQVAYPITYDPYYFRPDKQNEIATIKNGLRDNDSCYMTELKYTNRKDTLYYISIQRTADSKPDTIMSQGVNYQTTCDSFNLKGYICYTVPSNKICQLSKNKKNDEEIKKYRSIIKKKEKLFPYIDILEMLLFYFALLGKAFLFSVLLWVNRRNRFLFFLIHKANTLSDSEIMLRRFNKYYVGCMDKDSNS